LESSTHHCNNLLDDLTSVAAVLKFKTIHPFLWVHVPTKDEPHFPDFPPSHTRIPAEPSEKFAVLLPIIIPMPKQINFDTVPTSQNEAATVLSKHDFLSSFSNTVKHDEQLL